RAERPFHSGAASDLEAIREKLHTIMWDDAGIVRDAASLDRAGAALDALAQELRCYALPEAARERAYNLTWHDWLNLGSLVAVSKAIVRAAAARENSRGAHFRSDFPEPGDLSASAFIRVRERRGALDVEAVPVRFTRVQPGDSLIAS